MRSLYLKPGEYYFGCHPVRITTVLGSCVSVSMYHRPDGLAALCHVVAPDCAARAACNQKCAEFHRYVNCMIPAMARSFFSRGIRPKEMEVKLFGGAAMIDGAGRRAFRTSVGAMNIAAARSVLQQHGLHVISTDVGGFAGRKIIFDASTGDVLLKRFRQDRQPY